MEITTLGGIIAGIGLIVFGILESGDIMSFVNIPSIMIVFGGTLASTVISFPLSRLKSLFKVIGHAFRKPDIDLNDDLELVIQLAQTARRDGLLALEDAVDRIDNEFLKKGGRLLVDGCDPELIKAIMDTELDFLQERHAQGRAMLDAMAAYAPAYGMIGTLIGLINMLKNLSDADSLGPNMAVALVTTFYGVMIANLICLPLSRKLKSRSMKEFYQKQMFLEGLLAIQDGENPRIIREKLSAFIPPKELREPVSHPEVREAGETREAQ
jgi:chemotaxis protein MotA